MVLSQVTTSPQSPMSSATSLCGWTVLEQPSEHHLTAGGACACSGGIRRRERPFEFAFDFLVRSQTTDPDDRILGFLRLQRLLAGVLRHAALA